MPAMPKQLYAASDMFQQRLPNLLQAHKNQERIILKDRKPSQIVANNKLSIKLNDLNSFVSDINIIIHHQDLN